MSDSLLSFQTLILSLVIIYFLTGGYGRAVYAVDSGLGVTDDICSPSAHYSEGAVSFFGLVAWGDASIEGARKLGGGGIVHLGRISEANCELRSVLGISRLRTFVKGMIP